ncbi:MAG: YggU family protein [Deltaproteobacteria bacterium CG11_big_fil_rev_8_21_14_0_20_45_16]|nr:MAG: YggU family protein [Deltaproteobacteria bacterium CG11_big_fil_rev_8_21_14_0_20_45_16]
MGKLLKAPTTNILKLTIHLRPNSKKEAIEKIGENEYKIKVSAPAVDGKANSKLIKLLSESFGWRPSSISILKGHTSRKKIIQVECD